MHHTTITKTSVWEGVKSIRKGRKVLLFGVNTKAQRAVVQSQITFEEASILGTWLANATFPKAVQIMEAA